MPSIKAGTARKKLFLLALLAAVFGLAQPGVPRAGQDAIFANPKGPKMSPRLNLGKLNFDAFCAACHGKTGRGTESGPTFISRIYLPNHHPDGLFFKAAKDGARAHHWQFGDMPPVEGISDERIATIIAYIRAVQQANGGF